MHFFISTHLQVNPSILNLWLIMINHSPGLWLTRLHFFNRLTALIIIDMYYIFEVAFEHECKFSQVTYVTMVPWVGNETLRPLGVAMGNAVSVTRVWSINTKTPHVGRRQPMTSLPARPQYKGVPGKHVIRFFVWSLRPKHGTAPRGCSVSFPIQGTMVPYLSVTMSYVVTT